MNLIEKFKTLPEAKCVPDSVWTTQSLLDQLAELDAQRERIQQELYEVSPRMMRDLKKDWSDDELKEAGLMS